MSFHRYVYGCLFISVFILFGSRSLLLALYMSYTYVCISIFTSSCNNLFFQMISLGVLDVALVCGLLLHFVYSFDGMLSLLSSTHTSSPVLLRKVISHNSFLSGFDKIIISNNNIQYISPNNFFDYSVNKHRQILYLLFCVIGNH